jgi:hypothetical protein
MTVASSQVQGAPDAPQNGQVVSVSNVTATPTQVPITKGGATLINTGSEDVTLSIDGNFTSGQTVDLPVGVSLPWSFATTCFALAVGAAAPASITVVPGLLNYFSPYTNVQETVGQPSIVWDADVPILGGGSVGQINFPIPPGTRTLHIITSPPTTLPNTGTPTLQSGWQVSGTQYPELPVNAYDIDYASGRPYLLFAPGSWPNCYHHAVVTVDGDITPEIFVDWYDPGANFHAKIVADGEAYGEDRYYNQNEAITAFAAAAGGGSNVVINGPCRILNVTLECNGAPGSSEFVIKQNGNANPLVFQNTATAAGPYPTNTMEFPDNGIKLFGGDSLSVSGAGSATAYGQATYQYP